MFIYTCYKDKHLRMPVPKDWTMDEVKYFITGKEDGKPDFNPKPHLSLDKPQMSPDFPPEPAPAHEDYKAFVEAGSPDKATKPAPVADPTVKTAVSVQSVVSSSQVELTCAKHPGYTGMRLGKTVAGCLVCTAIYNARKAKGIKETRVRK